MGDADVAAVPAGLSAKLADEVGREAEDQRRKATVKTSRFEPASESAVARLPIPLSDIRRT